MASYSIKAVIGVVTDKLKEGIKGAGGILKKLGGFASQAAQQIIRAMGQAARAMTDFGMESVKVAATIDAGMREVFTLIPKMSAKMKKDMTKEMMELSQEMGKMPKDMTTSIYNALSSGIPKKNVFEFIRIAAKASIGGVSSTNQAVGALTTVLNGYKMTADKAADVSDTLFTIIKQGVTTMPELASNIGKVTPIAASLGISFEQVGAAFAEMTKNLGPGKSAEAGTQLKAMFSELSKASMDAFKNFEAASGTTFPKFMEQGGLLSDALAMMTAHAKKLGIRLPDLFGSIEAGSAALILATDNSKGLTGQMDAMGKKAGATQKAFNEVSGGVDFAMKQMAVAWISFKKVVGDSLGKVVELIMPAIMDTIGMMKSLPWDALGADIANVVASLLPLARIFFNLAREIFPMLGPSIKLVASILNITLAPVLALISRAVEFFVKQWRWIVIVLGEAAGNLNFITGLFVNLIGHIGKSTWGEELAKTIIKVEEQVAKTWTAIGKWIFTKLPQFMDYIMTVLAYIRGYLLKEFRTWIDEAISNLEKKDGRVNDWKLKILRMGKEIYDNLDDWIVKLEKRLEKWIFMLDKVNSLLRNAERLRRAVAGEESLETEEAREEMREKVKLANERGDKIRAARAAAAAQGVIDRAAEKAQEKVTVREMSIAHWRKRGARETRAHWENRLRWHDMGLAKEKEQLRVSKLSKKERQAEEKRRAAIQALGVREEAAASRGIRAGEKKRMDNIMKATLQYLFKSGREEFSVGPGGRYRIKANDLAEARKKWVMLQELRKKGLQDIYGQKHFLATDEDLERMNRRTTLDALSGKLMRQRNLELSRVGNRRMASQQQKGWETEKIAEWRKRKRNEGYTIWVRRNKRYDEAVARMNRQRAGGTPAQQIRAATMEQRKFNTEVQRNPMLTRGAGGRIGMKGAGAGAIDMKYQKAIIKRLDIAIKQRALIYKTLKGKFVNQ